jgi:hypothetical protein
MGEQSSITERKTSFQGFGGKKGVVGGSGVSVVFVLPLTSLTNSKPRGESSRKNINQPKNYYEKGGQ